MDLKSLKAYLYLNRKQEKWFLTLFLNIVLLLLAFRFPIFLVMIATYMLIQSAVNVEFSNDGANNIYLFIMGEPLKVLSHHRVVSKVLLRAFAILPSILMMAIWKQQIAILFYYLVVAVVAYVFALFKISIRYQYSSKLFQILMEFLSSMLFLFLVFNHVMDFKLKLIVCMSVLIAMLMVSNWILDHCDIEKIYIRGVNR